MPKIVGLIGIGLVGTAMARNLLAQHFTVVGFDIDPKRQVAFEQMGGIHASSPADVAGRAQRLVMSLLTSAIVQDVVEGKNGILSAKNVPQIIIDTTTGDPEATETMAHKMDSKGIAYLDATISGSSKEIANREGVFLVGGNQDVFDQCADIFNALTTRALYLGAAGAGARAKLAVNLVLGLNRCALAEGFIFAEKLGIPPLDALKLFAVTAANSQALEIKGPLMVSGDFTPYARLSQHRKDVEMILSIARKQGQHLPLSELHYKILKNAEAAGDGELDNAAIIREIRRNRSIS